MKLWHYIKGFRKGKEAHRLEKEAMSDPFLRDALDGYDRVDADHIKRIVEIRKQVTTRSHRKRNYYLLSGIAAGIMICLFTGVYLLTQKDSIQNEVLTAQEMIEYTPTPKAVIPAPDDALAVKREVTPSNDKSEPVKRKKETIVTSTEDTGNIQADVVVQPVTEDPGIPSLVSATVPDNDTIIRDQTGQVDIASAPVMMRSYNSLPVAQTRNSNNEIKGRVVTNDGEPIIGASVVQTGTDKGTITDLDGYFTLKTIDNKDIQVEYIGYESLTIPADTSKLMVLAMNEDQSVLDEVVVVGYSNKKKSMLTGSSTKTKSRNEIKPEPLIGKEEFNKYLKENLISPTDEECHGIKGTVTLAFTVNTDGKPDQIRIVKSLCTSADQEAIRLINEGPLWTTGDKEVTVKVKFR